jgi:hypothetical protein
VCVCVFVYPVPIVARQRLGKNPPIVMTLRDVTDRALHELVNVILIMSGGISVDNSPSVVSCRHFDDKFRFRTAS